jgi:hypothetical protein
MKESEANKKWCPHIAADCYGSDCMMWEAELKREDYKSDEMIPPCGDGWTKINERFWKRYVEADSGDCGLKSKYLECGY